MVVGVEVVVEIMFDGVVADFIGGFHNVVDIISDFVDV